MAALTEGRTTAKRDGNSYGRAVAAAKKIYEGSIVCLSATGFATPGATATTLVADGLATQTIDNSGGADGAAMIVVEKGVFRFANSAAGDAITRAEIGDDCYIVDDQTVAKTNGSATRSIAGKIMDVDNLGVWVKFA
ncbi:hypothetical protein [Novosphingobium sp.]|uniref:hypothetical protein n=1 Tax=Novosphingobium sp. TaxID=1874826 RepID=UPI002631B1C4|nr:hypothetical protein [Novosphingobium sp.]